MHRGKIWLSTLIFYVRYGESTGSTCIFLKRACAAPLILASKSFFSSVLCWTTDSSILLERFCLFMSVSLDACLFNYASLHSICKASWPQEKNYMHAWYKLVQSLMQVSLLAFMLRHRSKMCLIKLQSITNISFSVYKNNILLCDTIVWNVPYYVIPFGMLYRNYKAL